MDFIRRKSFILTFLILFSISISVLFGRETLSAIPQNGEVFIDQIYKKLNQSKGNWKGRTLAKAEDYVLSGKFALARAEAKKVRTQRKYVDFSHYIEGLTHIGEAKAHLKKKRFKSATTSAQTALDQFSQVEKVDADSPVLKVIHEKMGEAEMLLGEAFEKRKMRSQARLVLENAFARLNHKKDLSRIRFSGVLAYVRLCKKLSKKQKNEKLLCDKWMRRLAGRYPSASKSRKDLVKLNSSLRNLPRDPFFQKLFRSYRGSDKDKKAYSEAVDLYLSGEFKEALVKLQDFIATYEKSHLRYKALFWAGRAFEKLGYEEQAKNLYERVLEGSPLSFHGLVSSLRLGRPVESYIDASLPKAKQMDKSLNPKEFHRVTRSTALLEAGSRKLAAIDVRGLTPRSSLASPYLMYMAGINYELGNHLTSFKFINGLINRGHRDVVSSYGLRMIFPLAYEKVINQFAKEYEMDPILILSLIKQESAFTEDIVSHSGAVGLMQLMPFTATDMDPKVLIENLRKPEVNVKLGVKYLKWVIRKMDGNWIYALAGYNAGPHRVLKWKEKSKENWDMLDFIESIPYDETRGYVSAIMRNYFWYSYRLHGVKLTDLSMFWGASGPSPNPPSLPDAKTRFF